MADHIDQHDLTPVAAPHAPVLAPYDINHAQPFYCAVTIGEQHVSDEIAHLNNVELVRWLDRAAELHADSLGFTRRTMLDDGVMWFVARHEIDYRAEAWLNDELIIATWVRDVRRVKSWRDYVLFRPSDETVIARASTLWVLVDLATRRPARFTPIMQQRFLGSAESPTTNTPAGSTPCTSR